MLTKPRFFRTPAALARWFSTYGARKIELWIGYYKKASGRGGVVYKQALDEALCVGWIDGVIKSIDDDCYIRPVLVREPATGTAARVRQTVQGRQEGVGVLRGAAARLPAHGHLSRGQRQVGHHTPATPREPHCLFRAWRADSPGISTTGTTNSPRSKS